MTRDEVARIAKLAGIEKDHDVFFSVGEEEMDVHIDDLKRFAELVLESRAEKQEPVAWMHNHIKGNVIAHRPVTLDRHPEHWTALYPEPKPCPTCEALARTVMLDQISYDTSPKIEQEPVAFPRQAGDSGWTIDSAFIWRVKHTIDPDTPYEFTPTEEQIEIVLLALEKIPSRIYTHPPQRQPLTDEQIDELSRTMVKGNKSVNWLVRAIEAAHGITGEKK